MVSAQGIGRDPVIEELQHYRSSEKLSHSKNSEWRRIFLGFIGYYRQSYNKKCFNGTFELFCYWAQYETVKATEVKINQIRTIYMGFLATDCLRGVENNSRRS